MITPLSLSELCLETERLLLTPFAPHDVDIALALLTDPKVMYYVAEEPVPAETVKADMQRCTRRGAGGRLGIWCVTRKDTGQKIADGVLTPVPIDEDDINWESLVPEAYPDGQIEVGYLLIPSAWGQGFASEICARLLRFAFEMTELEEVVATTDPENAASQNVLQKCGMRPIGKKRAYNYDDVDWFEITANEWREAQG